MRRLRIDFAARSRRAAWPGRILMILAAAVCVDTAMTYHGARQAIALGEAQLASARPQSAPEKLRPEEVALVRETIDRLAMPWDGLLGALEAAASDDIALLGVEPDPKSGTVVISGDSRNYLAVLGYVLTLSRSEALSRVQLVRHDESRNDPHKPVNFAVSAGWAGVRR